MYKQVIVFIEAYGSSALVLKNIYSKRQGIILRQKLFSKYFENPIWDPIQVFEIFRT